MIPIHFSLKDEKDRTKITDTFYEITVKHCSSKRIKAIDDWCKKNIIIDKKEYSFKDIVIADHSKLQKIKEFIDENHVPMDCFYKTNKSGEKICYLIDHVYKHRVPRLFLIEALGITVCPYCNRNFVNSSRNRTFCQLDHFINKSDYPIFAVSFYNLIPVCACCNHAKSSKEFDISPHDLNMVTNDLILFSYHILDSDFLFHDEKIRIDMFYSNKIKSNIESLNLEELYQLHTDLIQEITKKTYIYSKEYLDDIMENCVGLFSSEDEFYRVVFGNYLNESDFAKRPLAKLTYDICQEVGLIY